MTWSVVLGRVGRLAAGSSGSGTYCPTTSSQRSASVAGHPPRVSPHARPGHPVAATNPARVPPFDLLESSCSRRESETEVPRRTLIGSMEDRSASMPIVYLSAGPGWGRTTLLGEWASSSRRPFAVASPSTRTTTIRSSCSTYIAIAIDRITPLDSAVFDALASPGASVEGTVVPRLGAALATIQPARGVGSGRSARAP